MENQSISAVLNRLIEDSQLQVNEVARRSGVNKNTLHSLLRRDSDRVSISTLRDLADFFDEDLDIFCGQADYRRKPRLTPDEEQLLATYRKLSISERPLMLEAAQMPANQKRLLAGARQLNEQGMQRLLSNCEDLIASGRYKA